MRCFLQLWAGYLHLRDAPLWHSLEVPTLSLGLLLPPVLSTWAKGILGEGLYTGLLQVPQ